MNLEQQRAILTLALFAAFADGDKHAREREEIRRIAESLAIDAGTPDLMKLNQDVLLRRTSIEGAAGMLAESELRQLAYEMAVCVCEADGQVSQAERRFLDNLQGLLALDMASADRIEHAADAIAIVGLPESGRTGGRSRRGGGSTSQSVRIRTR
jgi:tellurite resistance protein